MVTEQSIREKAKEAMTRLLSQAQNIKLTGGGELVAGDIATASSFFYTWKRKKIILPQIVLFLMPFLIFYNAKIGVFAIFIAFVCKYFQESGATKKRYIEEMIGNWAGIDEPIEYQKFLVLQLWKNLTKKGKKYNLDFNDLQFALQIAIIGLLSSIYFFLPNFTIFGKITILLILKFVIFVYSEIVIFLNFVDEP